MALEKASVHTTLDSKHFAGMPAQNAVSLTNKVRLVEPPVDPPVFIMLCACVEAEPALSGGLLPAIQVDFSFL